ncbi:MAG: hypothetical protein ACPGRX_00070 [Bdellovibrionales bacterium]
MKHARIWNAQKLFLDSVWDILEQAADKGITLWTETQIAELHLEQDQKTTLSRGQNYFWQLDKDIEAVMDGTSSKIQGDIFQCRTWVTNKELRMTSDGFIFAESLHQAAQTAIRNVVQSSITREDPELLATAQDYLERMKKGSELMTEWSSVPDTPGVPAPTNE